MVENTRLNVTETMSFEFKHYQPFSIQQGATDLECIVAKCDQYLNAFINSDGGTLYFGIADDGTVKGQQAMTREKQDLIRRGLDTRLSGWKAVNNEVSLNVSSALKVDFVPVIRRDDSSSFGYVVPDLFVIRINVTRQYNPKTNKPLYFTTYDKRMWVKKLASVGRCGEADIQLQSIAGHDMDEKVDETELEGVVLSTNENDADIDTDEPGRCSAPNSEDRVEDNMFQLAEMVKDLDIKEYDTMETCFHCKEVLKFGHCVQLKSTCMHTFCENCFDNTIIMPNWSKRVWPKCKCKVDVVAHDCTKWEKSFQEIISVLFN